MSRYVNDFSEDIIIQVLIAYLINAKSHRQIQREILNLPAPDRGGGFIAMDILHYFNIKGDKKGILATDDINNEINGSDGNYKLALRKVKAYKATEQSSKAALAAKKYEFDTTNTEIEGKTKIRINQNVLREYVLENYANKCSLCGIDKLDLLVCSHIKPWSVDEKNRLNPANAICFCVLHDKLFDRGYFSLDKNYRIVFGDKADQSIIDLFDGLVFNKPAENLPGIEFLEYHYKEICN